jgi:hypothetical protein
MLADEGAIDARAGIHEVAPLPVVGPEDDRRNLMLGVVEPGSAIPAQHRGAFPSRAEREELTSAEELARLARRLALFGRLNARSRSFVGRGRLEWNEEHARGTEQAMEGALESHRVEAEGPLKSSADRSA